MDKKNKTPNVPNLRFPYKGDWHKRKLNEICLFFKGNGLSKSDLSNEGFPCILYGELYTTYKNEVISDIVSKTTTTLSNPFLSKNNDLIIPGSGEDPIDIAVARAIYQNDIILGGDLNVLRPKSNVSAAFLSYQLNGVRRYDIAKKAQGKSIVHLHNSDLKEVCVSIPTYDEQFHIVKLLTKIDEMIETQSKIINALDSQRRCLFLKAHRAFSLKKVNIAEIGRMVAVNNLSKDELSIEGYDCILYGELFTKYNLYVDNVVSKTEKMDNAIVSGGNELLFPTSTTVDAISLIKPVALIKKGVILGGDMFSIKLKDSYNPIYISCLINFIYRRKFASKTQGSTIIHLHYRDIKNEIIEICDYEVQCKIAHLIESITEKIKVEEELLNLLYLQKSYLLQNMFI